MHSCVHPHSSCTREFWLIWSIFTVFMPHRRSGEDKYTVEAADTLRDCFKELLLSWVFLISRIRLLLLCSMQFGTPNHLMCQTLLPVTDFSACHQSLMSIHARSAVCHVCKRQKFQDFKFFYNQTKTSFLQCLYSTFQCLLVYLPAELAGNSSRCPPVVNVLLLMSQMATAMLFKFRF